MDSQPRNIMDIIDIYIYTYNWTIYTVRRCLNGTKTNLKNIYPIGSWTIDVTCLSQNNKEKSKYAISIETASNLRMPRKTLQDFKGLTLLSLLQVAGSPKKKLQALAKFGHTH